MAWATIEQLAALIERTADDRMHDDLAVALSWCADKRDDLDPDAVPTPLEGEDPVADEVATVPRKITRAVLIFATLLYRQRAGGAAVFESVGGEPEDPETALDLVYTLLGRKHPKAR